MDFGVVGFDGVVGLDNVIASSLAASDPETKQKWYGSEFLKHQRSGTTEDNWRDLKVAKTSDDFSASAMLLHQRSHLLRSNANTTFHSADAQHMLSFTSTSPQTMTLPYYHQTSTAFSKNTGYGSGGLNAASMHGVLTGVRGPFTPSQWMELEHQALIYKYMTANVPVPSHLLIPIKKARDSAVFSSFSGLRPNPLGWGGFHLGFSNNTDPEPGRCRRTDGKKWRCARDAVVDQKYCERHMNRGRHRSRKPVEGQAGHSASGPTTTGKLIPMASSTLSSVVPGSSASNSLGLSHHNNLQPGAPYSSLHLSSSFLNKENEGERNQDITGLSMLSPTTGLKENQVSIPKQQNHYGDSPRVDFGLVSSDSMLNPLHKSSSLINCRNYGTSEDFSNCESKSQNSLRQFMDDWPKTQTERSAFLWPNIDLQSDRTQLSISIPMACSDFMSSTSSPTNEKLALSPLRLSRELEPAQMGFGVGKNFNESNQRQANWIPISWETSMGGPLGEVLHSTSDCKNSSALNLMTEGWDSSPSLASSPTGVLQKTAFGSLSNSSAGSSPRAENYKSHCNNLLGSTLVNASLRDL